MAGKEKGMKTVIINGSPRNNWNTAQLLKETQKGAESVGAVVEYIDLYDITFTGCRSCLACKRKGIGNPCKCYWKDELTPVLESVLNADRMIIGSPIYYGEPTAAVRALLERVVFPAMSYSTYQSVFTGKIDVDVILTMNASEEYYNQGYDVRIKEYFAPVRFLNGEVRFHPVCDTLQVEDYSKYEMAGFSEQHKRDIHDKLFPIALSEAFKLGTLSEK